MNFYNGDVKINPVLLEDLSKNISELNIGMSKLNSGLDRFLKGMVYEFEALNKTVECLRNEVNNIRYMQLQSDVSPDFVEDEKDFRSLKSFDQTDAALSTNTLNALYRAGVYAVSDLALLDVCTLKRIRGIGAMALQDIKHLAAFVGIDIPKKFEVSPKIPDVERGDFVVVLSDSGKIPKGTIAEVYDVAKVNRRAGTIYRVFPLVFCEDKRAGIKDTYSISQLKVLH